MNKINVKEEGSSVTFQIVVIGMGGNGSHFVRTMLQMISGLKKSSSAEDVSFDITLVDADRVEKKNFHRQLFDEKDLDEYKVVSLVDRYSEYYGVPCKAVREYVTSTEMLGRLFGDGDLYIGPEEQVVRILIGLVDNNKTRQLFHEFFESTSLDNFIWIDAGIEGVMHFDNPTEEQQLLIDYSGYGGQVVCGLKYRGHTILEPVTQVYPNILEDRSTSFPGPQSCGDVIVNFPQRLATNQMAAQIVAAYINNLINDFAILTHKINFNAQFAQSKPTFIPKDAFEKYEGLKRGEETF